MNSVELQPSSGGVFEISFNGQTVFSKKALGRFPEEQEIEQMISAKLA